VETIASLTERIKDYDRKLKDVAEELYPETKLLRQVHGVGVLTALAFVLTLEDPSRFAKSREVGAYLGLVPATDQSGKSDPEKHISKHGNKMMRKLLVGSAHYILLAPSEKTPTLGVTEKGSPGEEARTPRRGRW
jgi:transposase